VIRVLSSNRHHMLVDGNLQHRLKLDKILGVMKLCCSRLNFVSFAKCVIDFNKKVV
jgi:hypothetical protein